MGARSPPDSPAKGARQDGHGGDGLVVSKPNSVSGDSFTGPSRSLGSRTGENVCCAPNRQPTTGAGDLLPTTDSHECGGGGTILVLLRKEVIQPHLPVRLPCYDFVPITDPTLGSSPLAVGPLTLGVTDFRDVTGGVYKPRERIHRSVADLRLLATPTSWGRVADPNPN